jgi:serine kinase of HPr protein (carbohydrate metabolism regulator)
MADIRAIVFVRNKKVTEQMIELARENNMVILESPYSLFKSSGLLFQAGLKPIY